jgi:hypothetical protein
LVVRNELQEVAVRHRVDQHNLGRTPHAQAIAVLDFNLAYDRFVSNPVFEVMSAARPLFHRKRKSIGYLAMSHKCNKPT